MLEILTNLIYLARMESHDKDKVILYMDLSNDSLQALINLLRETHWTN